MAGPSHQLHAMRRMVVINPHVPRPSDPREFAGLEVLIVAACVFNLDFHEVSDMPNVALVWRPCRG